MTIPPPRSPFLERGNIWRISLYFSLCRLYLINLEILVEVASELEAENAGYTLAKNGR